MKNATDVLRSLSDDARGLVEVCAKIKASGYVSFDGVEELIVKGIGRCEKNLMSNEEVFILTNLGKRVALAAKTEPQ